MLHSPDQQPPRRSDRNFALLVTGSASSNLADGILIVALPWLASELTRDPVLIGLVTAATRLPWLLLSIPAGVLGDRVARLPLIFRADVCRTLLGVVLAVLVYRVGSAPTDSVLTAISLLSLLAFLLGAAEVVRDNTAQTVLPDIVPHDSLERANGRLWSVEMTTNQLIAPPLAGVLIAASLVSPFICIALAYGFAALALSRVQAQGPVPGVRESWTRAVSEAWVWMRNHGELARLALLLGCINFSATAFMTVLVLYSRELMLLGPLGYGLLLGAAACGGILGGVLCPHVLRRLGGLPSVWVAFVLFAAVPLALWWNQSPTAAGVMLFVESFAAVLWNVVTVSWRQRSIPTRLLGRVNSLYRCAGWGFMAAGAVFGGVLVALVEPGFGRESALRTPFLFACLFNLALMFWACRWLRLEQSTVPA